MSTLKREKVVFHWIQGHAAMLAYAWQDERWIQWADEFLQQLDWDEILQMYRQEVEETFEGWVQRKYGIEARGE